MKKNTLKQGLLALCLFLNSLISVATSTDSTSKEKEFSFTFRGYADMHYSYDTNDPFGQVRLYNSNPLHVNQFDIGYSFIESKFQSKNIRATISIHHGSIVELMYLNEDNLMKRFREVSGEYFFTPKISLEAGIMPAHYGFEGFINKENWFATRAVMTDFAPDFDLGTRLTYRPNEHWLFRAQVANGWQTLRETNAKKSFGTLIRFENKKMMLNWGTMTTDESHVDTVKLTRLYSNFFATFHLGKWKIAPLFDYGVQRDSVKTGTFNPWFSTALAIRFQAFDKYAFAIRSEYFHDPHQIIPEVTTHTPNGFTTYDVTGTIEHTPSDFLTIRLEGRYSNSKDPIYTDHNGGLHREDFFLIASLAFDFHRMIK